MYARCSMGSQVHVRVEVCAFFLRTCSFRSWQNLSRFVSLSRPNSELKCKRRQEKNVFDHTCGVWVLDDVVSVQVGPLGGGLPGVFGVAGLAEGPRTLELNGGPNLLDTRSELALDHLVRRHK